MADIFECLACGRANPVRGANYSNKYCNNKCQQDHRRVLLNEQRVSEWRAGCGLYVWKEVPTYIRDYLVTSRGHRCEVCGITEWQGQRAPLLAKQQDGDVYNNQESNLELICPNCHSQKLN